MSVTSIAAANNAYLQAIQSDPTNPFRQQASASLQQAIQNMGEAEAGHRHHHASGAQSNAAASMTPQLAPSTTHINTTA